MSTFSIKIGGEAGQGLVSVGNILLQAIAKEGWHLFAHQDYESRIRGGHNFFQIRVADRPLYTWEGQSDVLVALDKATITNHRDELKDGGVILYDPGLVGEDYDGEEFVAVPFVQTTEDEGQPKVMANAVACGAIWAFLSEDIEVLGDVLEAMFADKGEDIVAGNRQVSKVGYQKASEAAERLPKPAKPKEKQPRLLMKGNDALPSGALAAGVSFMSAYPMTPSTGVTEFIAANQAACGVVMEQAEDEIAAINMAIGAAYTGVRAMTATSGGGFALMTEALGLAGSAEIPVVVINAQRPGPSTGLPTRTEQGDLLYAVATGSGDFPKAVLAPGDIEEAFELMGTAFNLAERYQMPVMVLSDQHLADAHRTVEPFDLDAVTIDRGKVVTGDAANDSGYKRYAYSEDGISPRLYPGCGTGLAVSAGDEHGEEGHLIEDAETRTKQMDKRMKKMEAVAEEALAPVYFGDDDAEVTLVSFGSTKGALREAVAVLQDQGVKARGVHVRQVFPMAPEIADVFQGDGKVYVVESSYTGQFERLLAAEFAVKPAGHVRRYDGRPLNAEYILEHLEGGRYRG